MERVQLNRNSRPIAFGRTRRQRLWLDILGADICSRIAAYVCNGEQNEAALLLAETNLELRRAVMSALSYKVGIFWNTQHGARWSMVAAEDVLCVTVSTHPYISPRAFDAFAPMNPLMLLQASTLRRAEISDEPAMLWAVKGSTSLRELLVRIASRTDFGLIWGTLASLNLEKLELECYGKPSYTGNCPNIHFAHYVRSLESNAARGGRFQMLAFCPNLSSLRMSCWPIHQTNPLGDWLHFFPKLREVTVTTYRDGVSDRISKLKGIESVKIINAHHSFRLAMHLGSSVTVLSTTEDLDDGQVANLQSCPRLTALTIGIKEGADRSLSDLSCIPRLRSLRLCWSKPTVRTPRNNNWYRGTCSRSAAIKGAMLRVVGRATSLVQLHLVNMRIDGNELTLILRCMGPRLQYFETSVCGQDESPFDRLEHIVEAMILYNPEVHFFGIEEELSWANQDAQQSISIQARRIRAGLRRLQCRAPLMNARRLKWHVNALIKDVILYHPGAKPVQMEAHEQLCAAESDD